MKKTILLLVILLVCMTIFAKEEVIKKRFEATPAQPVSVSFRDADGDLRVETYDGNEIILEFVKSIGGDPGGSTLEYFNGIKPQTAFADNRLEVKVEYPKIHFPFNLFHDYRLKVRSLLKVPRKCSLETHIVDGNVEAEGGEGNFSAHLTDGDVLLRDWHGDMDVGSTDGDLTLENVVGRLHCRTTDGDVTATGKFSAVNFSSSDGNGEFRFLEGSRLSGDCEFRCSDGDLTLAFPKDMSFRLNAHTSEGGIHSALHFDRVDLEKKHHLEAARGDAAYSLSIETSDGDVHITEY